MDRGLLRRVGSLDQVAGIRHYRVVGGAAEGTALFAVHNRAGLEYTVVADKCLDLFDFRYRGVNLAFRTKNGLVHPARVGSVADDFFNTWGGGMLATCGLANVGDACEEDGLHPVHGRIGNTPARLVQAEERWDEGDLVLEVAGEMSESRLHGRHLAMRRRVVTTLDSKAVEVRDEVTNLSEAEEPIFLLYHVNVGHPLLDEETHVWCNADDMDAPAAGPMGPPDAGTPMSTTLHRGGPQAAAAAVVNHRLGLGLGLEWDRGRLPLMHQWRNRSPGDYVLAIEPATCPVSGRAEALRGSPVPSLAGYSTASFGLTLTVLDGPDDIERFCDRAGLGPATPRAEE